MRETGKEGCTVPYIGSSASKLGPRGHVGNHPRTSFVVSNHQYDNLSPLPLALPGHAQPQNVDSRSSATDAHSWQASNDGGSIGRGIVPNEVERTGK